MNSCNFALSGNDTILDCKLYMPSLKVKSLISNVSEILNNFFVDTSLLLAFIKYILSQIYSHCICNCNFWNFLVIVETFVSWRKYFQGILIFMILFYPKTINFRNSGIVGTVLSTGVQHTRSFKWRAFGLKVFVTITPKG